MLKLRKDVTMNPHGKDVEVYRNLNAKCFSIKDRVTGLVVAHGDNFIVTNAVMRVGKGRERVLKEKRKNVHAVIRGTFVGNYKFDNLVELEEIYYNPYLLDCFVTKSNYEKIESCNTVYFSDGKAYLVD